MATQTLSTESNTFDTGTFDNIGFDVKLTTESQDTADSSPFFTAGKSLFTSADVSLIAKFFVEFFLEASQNTDDTTFEWVRGRVFTEGVSTTGSLSTVGDFKRALNENPEIADAFDRVVNYFIELQSEDTAFDGALLVGPQLNISEFVSANADILTELEFLLQNQEVIRHYFNARYSKKVV